MIIKWNKKIKKVKKSPTSRPSGAAAASPFPAPSPSKGPVPAAAGSAASSVLPPRPGIRRRQSAAPRHLVKEITNQLVIVKDVWNYLKIWNIRLLITINKMMNRFIYVS